MVWLLRSSWAARFTALLAFILASGARAVRRQVKRLVAWPYLRSRNYLPAKALRQVALVSFLTVSGCSSELEIQTVSRPNWRDQKPRIEDCGLTVYKSTYAFDASCEEVGDVFVGDTGWSVDCGWDRVVRVIQSEACKFGADAAQIVAHHEPSFFGSTCHQVRARFMVCDSEQRNDK